MNTHADKTQENKSQSVSATGSLMQSGGDTTFQFVDNRPEVIAQRKLQAMANNSPRAMQLRAFQDMANNSPYAKQAAQLHVKVPHHKSVVQRQIGRTAKGGDAVVNLKDEKFKIIKAEYDEEMGEILYSVEAEDDSKNFLVPASNRHYHLLGSEKRNRKANKITWEKSPADVDFIVSQSPSKKVQIDTGLLNDEYVGFFMKQIMASPPKNIETLEDILAQARDSINESGAIYEIGARMDDGILKIVRGSPYEKEVGFSEMSEDPMAEDLGLRGSVVTHTHPQGRPLSNGDIGKAAQMELAEIRAVGLTVCSVRPREGNVLTFETKVEEGRYAISKSSQRMQEGMKTSNDGSEKWVNKKFKLQILNKTFDLSASEHLKQWFGAAYAAEQFNWSFTDGTGRDLEGRDARAYAALVLEKLYDIGEEEAWAAVEYSGELRL